MAENGKNLGRADLAHINVNDPWTMRYWTKELRSSEDQIKAAVAKVGVSTEAVRQELKRSRPDLTPNM